MIATFSFMLGVEESPGSRKQETRCKPGPVRAGGRKCESALGHAIGINRL
jgi:hypothetical protein